MKRIPTVQQIGLDIPADAMSSITSRLTQLAKDSPDESFRIECTAMIERVHKMADQMEAEVVTYNKARARMNRLYKVTV